MDQGAPWPARCCWYIMYQAWERVRDLGQSTVLEGRCDRLTIHRVGEGRACWSLGNAYVSMGSPAQALTFAKKHLQISQEVSWAHSPRSVLASAAHHLPCACSPQPFLSTLPKRTVPTCVYQRQLRGARICFPLRMLVSPVWIPSSSPCGTGPCWVSGMPGVTS